MKPDGRYNFNPEPYRDAILGIVQALDVHASVDERTLTQVLKRFPRDGNQTFSKSQIIQGYRFLARTEGLDLPGFVEKVRMKPVRTASGVAPVTVLTKPFPCPGECIFCPNDVRMPKSYLSMEPGAQRAFMYKFDPFAQMFKRIHAFHRTGHSVDKVELIVLGGTWSFYPEPYQIWFIKRCFDAMNAFAPEDLDFDNQEHVAPASLDFAELQTEVNGRDLSDNYNQVVGGFLRARTDASMLSGFETATWEALEAAQRENESAHCRNVGLVLETRPDEVTKEETLRLRRLGATKIQIGIQSLDDAVLRANKRGHTVEESRQAIRLLRRAGFKVHAHWMPNLHTAFLAGDLIDYDRLFDDPAIRPDELKVYPCSLIESAELMQHYERGEWSPYSHEDLLKVLGHALTETPEYCRLTRVVRDIPSHDIVVGNKLSNFRELAEKNEAAHGATMRDIRAREIRGAPVEPEGLNIRVSSYLTSETEERFLQFVTPENKIVAFLRLSLPKNGEPIEPSLKDAAMIREVHVYGKLVAIGKEAGSNAQHLGLGTCLVEEAVRQSQRAGYASLAVISAIGTRQYYRRLGFVETGLYMNRHFAF